MEGHRGRSGQVMAQSRSTLRTMVGYAYGMVGRSVLVNKGVTLGDCATISCDTVLELNLFVW